METKAKKKSKKGTYTEKKNSEEKPKVKEKAEIVEAVIVESKEVFPQTKELIVKPEFDAPLVNVEQAVKAWDQYHKLINALVKSSDIVEIGGVKKAKKSGMNKIAKFFGYNCEIVRAYKEDLVGPQGGRFFVWRVWVKAIAHTGRFRVSGAACASNERRFAHIQHDVYATAETRAKKRAIEELAGMGEIELMEEGSKPEQPPPASDTPPEVPEHASKEDSDPDEVVYTKYKTEDNRTYVRKFINGKKVEEGIDPNKWKPMFEISSRKYYGGKAPINPSISATEKQKEFIVKLLVQAKVNPKDALFELNNRMDCEMRKKSLEECDKGDAYDLLETFKQFGLEGFMELVAI